MRTLLSFVSYLFWFSIVAAFTLLFDWALGWSPVGFGVGLGLGLIFALIIWVGRYWLIDLLLAAGLEKFCLSLLDRSDLDEYSPMYPLLNAHGFYFVRHRRARTVFRRGVFLHLLESPLGHRWHHIWPYSQRQEPGPEIELSTTFVAREYTDIPTSMGTGLAERLSGKVGVILEPGRPVAITIKLVIGYVFRPQNGTVRDAFEKAIHRTAEERSNTVCVLTRPHLERITVQFSPIDINLRITDNLIRPQLVESLQRLRDLGYEVTSVEIDSIKLPDSLETAFVANQELLRQSVSHYSANDLARMLATQMGQGMRTGIEPVPGINLGTAVQQNLWPGLPGQQESAAPDEAGPVYDQHSGGVDQPAPPPTPADDNHSKLGHKRKFGSGPKTN